MRCLQLETARNAAGTATTTCSGEVDAYTCPRLRQELIAVLDAPDPPGSVVVDLGGVTHIDSSGLGMLVAIGRRCQERDIEFGVRNLNPTVRRAFALTGVDRVLGRTA